MHRSTWIKSWWDAGPAHRGGSFALPRVDHAATLDILVEIRAA
jgi:hypothetical protein